MIIPRTPDNDRVDQRPDPSRGQRPGTLPAADGFAKGWEQWLRGANDVLEALHTMSRLLGDTGHDYAGSDTSSADSLGPRSAPPRRGR
jgi:hypothetical protein